MNSIKKKCSVLLVMAVLLFCSIVSANAATCTAANIIKVGVNPTNSVGASDYFVMLDCIDNSVWNGNVSYYLSTDLGDSGLATLLTAYSLDKTVWARTASTGTGSLVTIIYMNE